MSEYWDVESLHKRVHDLEQENKQLKERVEELSSTILSHHRMLAALLPEEFAEGGGLVEDSEWESIEVQPQNKRRSEVTVYNETNQALVIVALPMIDRIDTAMQCLSAAIGDEVADWVYFQNGNADKAMEILRKRYQELAGAISALRGKQCQN